MKISPWRRVLILGLVLCAVAVHGVCAQDDFRIISVHPTFSNDLIKVGNAWRKDLAQRIQVSLQVANDTPASSVFVKAYFYDHDDKLVGSYGKPNSIWTSTSRGIEEVNLPTVLPHGKTTTAYFALPEDLKAKKWTTVLIVFGNNKNVVANATPSSELPKLDFPEKAKITLPQ